MYFRILIGVSLICLILKCNSLRNIGIQPQNGIRHATRLFNIGSDALVRPEEEDTPEYKEYLKALLKMQANRATSGFAQPSSGSSDAYFAKLTRLKIERNARVQAGLPDLVDTSYKEEDYLNAKFESQEPMVRAAPMGGTGAGGVRQPGPDELRAMELAKEKVNAELNGMESLPEETANALTGKVVANAVNMNNPYASSMVDKVIGDSLMDNASLGMIDQIVSGNGLAGVTKLVKDDIDSSENQGEPQSRSTTATENNYNNGGSGVNGKIRGRDAIKRAMKEAIKAKTPEVEEEQVKVVEEKKVEKMELSEGDMEIAAKGLHSLVQHRGGGPFGKGRLSDPEQVKELEENLLNVLSMINKVDGSGIISTPTATPAAPASTQAVPKASLMTTPDPAAALFDDTPPPKQQQQQSVPEDIVTDVTPRPPAPVPVSVQTPVTQTPPAPPANSQQPKTIAGGLDDFLRAPQELSPEQLEGLRDGLIQCLGMIQQQIASNPKQFSPSPIQTRSVPPPLSASSPAASSGNTKHLNQEPQNIDEEIRYTLGLLLKHRGGPGFGHGRLEGQELEALEINLKSITSKLREEVSS